MSVETSMRLMGYPAEYIEQATSSTEAIRLADWHTRYALDRLDGTEHRGVRAHLVAGQVQLTAAMKLASEHQEAAA